MPIIYIANYMNIPQLNATRTNSSLISQSSIYTYTSVDKVCFTFAYN